MGIVRQKLSIKQILHLKSYDPKMKLTPENQKTYDDFIAKQTAFVQPKKVKKIKQDLEPTTTGEIDFEEETYAQAEVESDSSNTISESL